MRTTIDIADDVLFAAKDIARRDKRTLGQAITELMRQGLSATLPPERQLVTPTDDAIDRKLAALGFVALPSRGGIVTNEMVNAIREQEGI